MNETHSPETLKLAEIMADACAKAGFHDVAKNLREAFPKEEPVKPCPFCGCIPEFPTTSLVTKDGCCCVNPECAVHGFVIPLARWQNRRHDVAKNLREAFPQEEALSPSTFNYPLFRHMVNAHKLILLDSELEEIRRISAAIKE